MHFYPILILCSILTLVYHWIVQRVIFYLFFFSFTSVGRVEFITFSFGNSFSCNVNNAIDDKIWTVSHNVSYFQGASVFRSKGILIWYLCMAFISWKLLTNAISILLLMKQGIESLAYCNFAHGVFYCAHSNFTVPLLEIMMDFIAWVSFQSNCSYVNHVRREILTILI